MNNSNNLIKDIIDLEWEQFQHVKNEGGRALCQDDWNNFYIYRKSQFQAWNEEMLKSYHNDLTNAISEGRNLLTEKYARMMKSTAPERYQSIKGMIPKLSDKKIKLINNISDILVKWSEEYAKVYPNLSANGRPIHSSEDGPNVTSIETYSKGELSTYSEETLSLYYEYINELLEEDENLSIMIMENTVKEYGYHSIVEAENLLNI